jgi:hypothetical protein
VSCWFQIAFVIPTFRAALAGDNHEMNTFQILDFIPALCDNNPPCPIQGKSRERHEAGTGGGGRGEGVQRRTPPPRQPKLHGPGARARASLGTHGGRAVRRLPSARHCRWSPSGGEASAPEREGSPKSNDHRGSCGAGFKHRVRDAGELADLRFAIPDGASSKSIVPPERREAIRPAGPTRTRRPARP